MKINCQITIFRLSEAGENMVKITGGMRKKQRHPLFLIENARFDDEKAYYKRKTLV